MHGRIDPGRLDDAMHATSAAINEGIFAGSGIAASGPGRPSASSHQPSIRTIGLPFRRSRSGSKERLAYQNADLLAAATSSIRPHAVRLRLPFSRPFPSGLKGPPFARALLSK